MKRGTNARWWRVFGPRRFSWGIKVGLAVASTLFLLAHAGFDAWLFANLLAAVGWAFSYRASTTPALLPDPVVEGEELVFGEKHRIPLSSIVAAYRVWTDVEVETRDGDRFVVNRYSNTEADALLEQLGFAGRRHVTARVASPDARFAHLRVALASFGVAVLVAQVFFQRAAALEAATVLGLFFYELRRFREPRREVRVGNDGVVVEGKRGGIALLQEMKTVTNRGIPIDDNLVISDRAHVIFPYHLAEEAVFEKSRGEIERTLQRYGAEGPGKEGSVSMARAEISGLKVMAFDSPVHHAFTFTPALSLFVDCASEVEQERLVATLGEGGGTLMPLDNYGFSRRFAWVNDRFGVSWQINLP